MIEIKFFENKKHRYGIAIKGHANYAPIGEDIICASATAAITALGYYIEEHESLDSWKVLEVKLESGDINVEAIANTPYSNESLYHLFHMTIEYLKALAESYPCHVKIC